MDELRTLTTVGCLFLDKGELFNVDGKACVVVDIRGPVCTYRKATWLERFKARLKSVWHYLKDEYEDWRYSGD